MATKSMTPKKILRLIQSLSPAEVVWLKTELDMLPEGYVLIAEHDESFLVFAGGQAAHPVNPTNLSAEVKAEILYIKPIDVSADHRNQVRQALVTAGLSLPTPASPFPAMRLSEEQRAALAERFASGGPLSELIIEEREGR